MSPFDVMAGSSSLPTQDAMHPTTSPSLPFTTANTTTTTTTTTAAPPQPQPGMFFGYEVLPGHPAFQPPGALSLTSNGSPEALPQPASDPSLADKVRNPKRNPKRSAGEMAGGAERQAGEPGKESKAVVSSGRALREAGESAPVVASPMSRRAIEALLDGIRADCDATFLGGVWDDIRRTAGTTRIAKTSGGAQTVHMMDLYNVGQALGARWGAPALTPERFDLIARKVAGEAGLLLRPDDQLAELACFLRGVLDSARGYPQVQTGYVSRFLDVAFSPAMASHVAAPYVGRQAMLVVVRALGGEKIEPSHLAVVMARVFVPASRLAADDPRKHWDGHDRQVAIARLCEALWIGNLPNLAMVRWLRYQSGFTHDERAVLMSGLTADLQQRVPSEQGQTAVLDILLNSSMSGASSRLHLAASTMALAAGRDEGFLPQDVHRLQDNLGRTAMREGAQTVVRHALHSFGTPTAIKFICGLMDMVDKEEARLEASASATGAHLEGLTSKAQRGLFAAMCAAVTTYALDCPEAELATLHTLGQRYVKIVLGASPEAQELDGVLHSLIGSPPEPASQAVTDRIGQARKLMAAGFTGRVAAQDLPSTPLPAGTSQPKKPS